jgi:hypothetical protein
VKADITNYNNHNKNTRNSKFFNSKNSRSESKNKGYKNGISGVLDIVERRRQQQFGLNAVRSGTNDEGKMLHNMTHQHINYK